MTNKSSYHLIGRNEGISMAVVAIIQARMGSTRFPGKMLKQLRQKPLIWHVINRVKQAKLVDKIVLATSANKNNEPLIKEVEKYDLDVFVGDENDVLDRFYQCAKKFNATTIVRVTGDCPLIDPDVIDDVVRLFKKNKLDYASNVLPPTYPDGLDVEVFSFAALEKAWNEAKLKSEREHVTPYIWKNEHIFKRMTHKNDEDLSSIRLTVDEERDLVLVNSIIQKIGSNEYRLKDIMKVIRENPSLLKINMDIERNEGYQKSLKEDHITKR